MSLLAGTSYDPATAVSVSMASLTAMTAFDTTNLRLSFNAPANGSVLVRIAVTFTGNASSVPAILLGVLSGASVIARQFPQNQGGTLSASANLPSFEALFTVTGLTAGSLNTWDAAYAVQTNLVATNLKYGGPNTAATGSAFGGLQFEIYSAEKLLASTLYDPAAKVSVATTSLTAMTAFDTTNLRLTFTAPASGFVLVRLRVGVQASSATVAPVILLGILDGATVRLRVCPINQGKPSATASRNFYGAESQGVVTGLAGSFTWDAAYAVQTTAGVSMNYGGPNNTSGPNASGGFLYEIWAV